MVSGIVVLAVGCGLPLLVPVPALALAEEAPSGREAVPVSRRATPGDGEGPDRRGASPSVRGTGPAGRADTPPFRGMGPAGRGETPVVRGTGPIGRGESPPVREEEVVARDEDPALRWEERPTVGDDALTGPDEPSTVAKPVVLKPGDRGELVKMLQRRMRDGGYYFGKVGGVYDEQTKFGVYAVQKAHRLTPKGAVGSEVWRALDRKPKVHPLVPNGAADRVEVNLTRQLLTLYRDRRPVLYAHISTGAEVRWCHQGRCGDAVTPVGDFKVTRRAPGWTKGDLGAMFNSLYFVGGIALHGATRLPLHPASHGCVRMPVETSKRVYQLVGIGHPVHVRGKVTPPGIF
ncbi:L,D-transpeptidase family protein [Nonomuraea jiangxiensis]|nr:L,D-transpeptidase family protein [Nonomuraea jiangxiensis]